jgi:hypothetical protein
MQYMNVGEHWALYDTIVVGTTSRDTVDQPGWYSTLANLGAANRLFFFNQRTRSSGLAYCNQDVRDQMPYAFRVFSGGVTFWASSMSEANVEDDSKDYFTSENVPHIFKVDLPRHCSFTLQVQQDELLKTNCMLVPPGYGPSGGGVGRGSPQSEFTAAVDKTFNAMNQNVPHLSNRWEFPQPLEIPRNAALSVNLVFSEYAKQLLGQMTRAQWQDAVSGNGHAADIAHTTRSYYGIQVTLVGERLVQQRGAYHR